MEIRVWRFCLFVHIFVERIQRVIRFVCIQCLFFHGQDFSNVDAGSLSREARRVVFREGRDLSRGNYYALRTLIDSPPRAASSSIAKSSFFRWKNVTQFQSCKIYSLIYIRFSQKYNGNFRSKFCWHSREIGEKSMTSVVWNDQQLPAKNVTWEWTFCNVGMKIFPSL